MGARRLFSLAMHLPQDSAVVQAIWRETESEKLPEPSTGPHTGGLSSLKAALLAEMKGR